VGLFQKFIAKLGNKEEAIKAAVKYCSKHDILEGFLEMHGSEVLNMLLTEWNTEDCIAVRCEEAREDERKYVLDLLDQGLSPEEIKLRLLNEPRKPQ